MRQIAKNLILATLGIASLPVAAETVGTVVTPGRVLVNNLAVRGNANLSDGATLKTTADAARIELAGGGAISLDMASEATLYRGRVQLRQGKGMLAGAAGRIEALGLQVNSGEAQSQVLVTVNGSRVEVSALRGSGKVRDRQGLTLAMVHKGKPLSFEPGSGTNQSTVTGRLRREGAKFILQDELTGIHVELQGDSLGSHQGKRIQASGETRIVSDSDAHVVLVSRLNRLDSDTESSPSSGGASNPSSSTDKASPASTGMSAGTKIALAALTFGGLSTAIAVPLAMSN